MADALLPPALHAGRAAADPLGAADPVACFAAQPEVAQTRAVLSSRLSPLRFIYNNSSL
jgi:hypothetical protein